jgi:hypothetical protein
VNDTQKQKVKAYHTPRLVVYGDIRTLTQTVAHTTTTADGGMGQTDKTG